MASKLFTQLYSASNAVELNKDINRLQLCNLVELKRCIKNNEQTGLVFYYGTSTTGAAIGLSPANTPYANSIFLENALNTGLYKKITIGTNPADVYTFCRPIRPKGVIIEYNCIIKIQDYVSSLLTANVFVDYTMVNVVDASIFYTGQQVIITDNNAYPDPDIGGKKWGWGGTILSINGNQVVLDTKCNDTYRVVDNAYMATLQSVILIENTSNCGVHQLGGYINGNKANQPDIHPVYKANNGTIVEAYKQACGISVFQSNYTAITDSVIIRNASMHGLSFSSDYTGVLNSYIDIGDIHVYDSDEKGIHLKWTEYGKLGNVVVDNCVHQDGVIFYSTNSNWTVESITLTSCGRTGFDYNATNNNVSVGDITITGTCGAYAIDINSENLTIGNVTAGANRVRISKTFAGAVNNIDVTSITIDNCVIAVGDPIVEYVGYVTDIIVGTLTINNSTGIGIKTTDNAGVCDDCFVNGGGCFGHTGARTSIAVGSDITLVGIW